MSGKYLIFGATGSIGSNLSKMMAENNEDVQLIGRDEENLKSISSSKPLAISINCKSLLKTIEKPSKINSSCPPTRLQ